MRGLSGALYSGASSSMPGFVSAAIARSAKNQQIQRLENRSGIRLCFRRELEGSLTRAEFLV